MRRNDCGSRTRGEIRDFGETNEQEQKKEIEGARDAKDDVLTGREAIEGMSGMETLEGVQAAMDSLEQAEACSVGEFNEESDAFRETEGESERNEQDLNQRAEAGKQDSENLDTAARQMHSDNARGPVEQAEAQTQEDVAFLESEEQGSRRVRETNAQELSELERTVTGSGG
jgi:hypothetical protein